MENSTYDKGDDCNGHAEPSSVVTCIKHTDEIPTLDIEDALQRSGSCGRFQIFLQIVVTFLVLVISYIPTFSYFILDDPPWRCVYNQTNQTNPVSHFCKEWENNTNAVFASDNKYFSQRCKMKRSQWTYVKAKRYSAVTEYDLVCDKATWNALCSAMIFIGGLFGAAFSGSFADTYGRKPVMVASLIINTIGSIACAYVTNIWQLTGIRAMIGASFISCYNTSVVYLMEFVAPRYRSISGVLSQVTYCGSMLLSDLLAYELKDWRQLHIYITLPSVLALVVYIFLPESPRWLLSMMKVSRAENVLAKVAKYNGRSLKSVSLQVPEDSIEKNYSYVDLFRHWKIALLTVAQGMIWGAIAMLYFAISLESSKLGGNMHYVFAFSSLVELPGTFLTMYLCNRFGRKGTVLCCLFLGALFTGGVAMIPRSYSEKHNALEITFAVIVKFFINITYVAIYIWTFEIYPTVVRSQGLAAAAIFERVGGLCAPFLVNLLQNISYVMPFIIMAVVGISTSLFGLVLPETNNMPTRDVYEDFFVHKQQTDVTESNGTEAGVRNDIINSDV